MTVTEDRTAQAPAKEVGKARRMAAWTRERVFEHPFAALGMAVAAGFMVGRLVRWR